MRIFRLLITGILMAASASSYAQSTPNNNDSLLTISQKNINIYKLIIAGKESEIKKYFNTVSLDDLIKSDSGAIAKAFKRINTNDKVTRTIWVLEEIKNRNVEVRSYVYSELLKADFGKPSFLLNHMINNYFVNFKESDTTLIEKVRKLQRKMNR